MKQAHVSKGRIPGEPGFLASRRRILQGAAAAAAGIAVGRLGPPPTAWADDNGGQHHGDEHENDAATILRFSTMAGIHGAFVGAPFLRVNGGGAPWVIVEGKGSLTSDGHLKVRVRGLVLDPAVAPPPNGGTNPVPSFMAIVSGFSTDPLNPIAPIQTPLFAASKTGDADIEAMVPLPHPFFAPVIFVASLPLGNPPAPRWFAVTGLQ